MIWGIALVVFLVAIYVVGKILRYRREKYLKEVRYEGVQEGIREIKKTHEIRDNKIKWTR